MSSKLINKLIQTNPALYSPHPIHPNVAIINFPSGPSPGSRRKFEHGLVRISKDKPIFECNLIYNKNLWSDIWFETSNVDEWVLMIGEVEKELNDD